MIMCWCVVAVALDVLVCIVALARLFVDVVLIVVVSLWPQPIPQVASPPEFTCGCWSVLSEQTPQLWSRPAPSNHPAPHQLAQAARLAAVQHHHAATRHPPGAPKRAALAGTSSAHRMAQRNPEIGAVVAGKVQALYLSK